MPKNHIKKQATDVIYLKKYYKKLSRFLILLYLVMGVLLSKIFIYNFSTNQKSYFLITSFGKLIEIFPENQK
jgi:polyferredoxin